MSKYNICSGHAFSSREMFMSFDGEKIGIQIPKDCSERPTRYRRYLAAKVFATAFVKMIDDIIDNNVVIKLPTKTESFIETYKLDREELSKARKKGAFKDLDLIKAAFYGVIIQLRYKKNRGYSTKRIIVDNKRKQRLYESLYNKKI